MKQPICDEFKSPIITDPANQAISNPFFLRGVSEIYDLSTIKRASQKGYLEEEFGIEGSVSGEFVCPAKLFASIIEFTKKNKIISLTVKIKDNNAQSEPNFSQSQGESKEMDRKEEGSDSKCKESKIEKEQGSDELKSQQQISIVKPTESSTETSTEKYTLTVDNIIINLDSLDEIYTNPISLRFPIPCDQDQSPALLCSDDGESYVETELRRAWRFRGEIFALATNAKLTQPLVFDPIVEHLYKHIIAKAKQLNVKMGEENKIEIDLYEVFNQWSLPRYKNFSIRKKFPHPPLYNTIKKISVCFVGISIREYLPRLHNELNKTSRLPSWIINLLLLGFLYQQCSIDYYTGEFCVLLYRNPNDHLSASEKSVFKNLTELLILFSIIVHEKSITYSSSKNSPIWYFLSYCVTAVPTAIMFLKLRRLLPVIIKNPLKYQIKYGRKLDAKIILKNLLLASLCVFSIYALTLRFSQLAEHVISGFKTLNMLKDISLMNILIMLSIFIPMVSKFILDVNLFTLMSSYLTNQLFSNHRKPDKINSSSIILNKLVYGAAKASYCLVPMIINYQKTGDAISTISWGVFSLLIASTENIIQEIMKRSLLTYNNPFRITQKMIADQPAQMDMDEAIIETRQSIALKKAL